jgi:hypothetical protein
MSNQVSREAAKPRRDVEQLSALVVESAYRLQDSPPLRSLWSKTHDLILQQDNDSGEP